jgi:translation elongation factor EF-4
MEETFPEKESFWKNKKKEKKRMKQIGNVNIPQEAFVQILKSST